MENTRTRIESDKIEFWNIEDFKDRKITVTIQAGIETIKIPGDIILCDCCNMEIIGFPVKVIDKMVYCDSCFNKNYEII